MNAEQIIEKVWDILPDWAKKDWRELPTDIDSYVAHDWIRDVLKVGLIKMYKEFDRQIKNKECEITEVSGIISLQDTICLTLGMVEVYFSEFK